MARPKGRKNFTDKERLNLLVNNHKEYFNKIMLSFANQYHELVSSIEKELNKNCQRCTLCLDHRKC